MCKLLLVLSCVIMLLTTVLSAKEVTMSGTIIDTVLQTAAGTDPVLKIGPASACKIVVTAGCIEEVTDKYFATTNSEGKFSVKITLPETCKYKSYIITVACTTSSKAKLYKSYTPPKDSTFDQINVNFTKQTEYVIKTIQDSDYSHFLSFYKPPTINSGDTLKLSARTMALVDMPDTLKYPECGGIIELATSNGMIVAEQNVTCSNGSFTYIQQKNSYSEQLINIVIPKNIQLNHPDFKSDRSLKLLFRVGTQPVESYSFTVIDSDIKVNDLTGMHSVHKNKASGSIANMSIYADKISLNIYKAGNYSLDLFTPDGQMIQRFVKKQHFEPGKYSFTASRTKSSQMIIGRLTSEGEKVSMMFLR